MHLIFGRFSTTKIKKLVKDESGATAIEYALIATMIFLVIIASVTVVGTALSSIFQKVAGNLPA